MKPTTSPIILVVALVLALPALLVIAGMVR